MIRRTSSGLVLKLSWDSLRTASSDFTLGKKKKIAVARSIKQGGWGPYPRFSPPGTPEQRRFWIGALSQCRNQFRDKMMDVFFLKQPGILPELLDVKGVDSFANGDVVSIKEVEDYLSRTEDAGFFLRSS